MLDIPRIPSREVQSRSASPSRVPASPYALRMPSPPRILVPPAVEDERGILQFSITNKTVADFAANGFENTEFLQKVAYDDGDFLEPKNTNIGWKYEWRHHAHSILPFIFLGPVSAARDREFLRREGITMVIAVRNTLSAQAKLLAPKAPRDLNLHYLNIDVAGNQELIATFPRAIDAINLHLSSMYQQKESENLGAPPFSLSRSSTVPGKVLVFCESGNERSAGVVAAYIMAMYSVGVVEAIQLISSRRFCTSFNDPMRQLLKSYESILSAKRDVARLRGVLASTVSGPGDVEASAHRGQMSPVLGTAPKGSKRTIEDFDGDYDGDMDVDTEFSGGGGDDERFTGRSRHIPFEDDMS